MLCRKIRVFRLSTWKHAMLDFKSLFWGGVTSATKLHGMHAMLLTPTAQRQTLLARKRKFTMTRMVYATVLFSCALFMLFCIKMLCNVHSPVWSVLLGNAYKHDAKPQGWDSYKNCSHLRNATPSACRGCKHATSWGYCSTTVDSFC